MEDPDPKFQPLLTDFDILYAHTQGIDALLLTFIPKKERNHIC